ncbi:DUF4870 domain-containing protein [Naasia aerilata]|uniref:Membrane protein n=1 Tax=Naasia aerilata TaxID=1162966 RepID=A0ABN6XSK6_9MICO|nr:DUF4870 domain-containing protein [Naasia aerilata]BDZ46636.1 membrane protein [Naasia aerilata]
MTDSNLPPQGPTAGQPQQPYTAPAPAAPLTPAEDRQWAMWSHIGGVAILFWAGWLPPLILWLVFKDRGSLTRQEAKESLNFQLTLTAALLVNAILGVILGIVTLGFWFLVQTLIHWAIVIVGVVFSIIAGVRVNGGGTYRYPFAIRFIK